MSLGTLIVRLEAEDPDLVLSAGATHPHSYRGYYDELALEPASDVRVGDLLAELRGAVDHTYIGWKGGDFTMKEWTQVWLAERGDVSDNTLGPALIEAWIALAKVARDDADD